MLRTNPLCLRRSKRLKDRLVRSQGISHYEHQSLPRTSEAASPRTTGRVPWTEPYPSPTRVATLLGSCYMDRGMEGIPTGNPPSSPTGLFPSATRQWDKYSDFEDFWFRPVDPLEGGRRPASPGFPQTGTIFLFP